MDELFKGRHIEREIFVLRVRWYLRYKLSLRDLVELMAERGPAMARTTIMRFVPDLEKRWNRVACKAGRSCGVDETDVGKWMLGFNVFDRAAVTIAGEELLHRIRKGQFNLGRLPMRVKPCPQSGTQCSRLDRPESAHEIVRPRKKSAPKPQ